MKINCKNCGTEISIVDTLEESYRCPKCLSKFHIEPNLAGSIIMDEINLQPYPIKWTQAGPNAWQGHIAGTYLCAIGPDDKDWSKFHLHTFFDRAHSTGSSTDELKKEAFLRLKYFINIITISYGRI